MKSSSLNTRIHQVYAHPLPFELVALPPLVIHNPVSILNYLYAYFFARPVQLRVRAEITVGSPPEIKVYDPKMMLRLWQWGFFGKGSLSRSEPSWFGRTARRLGLDGGDMSLEEITEQRRQARREQKFERSKREKRALYDKKIKEGIRVSAQELAELDAEPIEPPKPNVRQEDLALITENSIKRLEYLQLLPCEALFLAGLGVLDFTVDGNQADLVEMLPKLCQDSLVEYVVYHYFESRGWCVRSGTKFGTDFLLYRGGPPFHHAEFAVVVVHEGHDTPLEWFAMQSVARVLGGVKKTLVFAYVRGPKSVEWGKVRSMRDFKRVLEDYTVSPIIFSRWSPARTRE